MPSLTDALQDKDVAIRAGAAEALGAIGPAAKPAIPALRRATRDEEESVRKAAAAALQALSPDGELP